MEHQCGRRVLAPLRSWHLSEPTTSIFPTTATGVCGYGEAPRRDQFRECALGPAAQPGRATRVAEMLASPTANPFP